jgi:vacuolar-type H+-ATPase subunit I/STV1
MREERTITEYGRVSTGRLWWSSIFGGTFFALGIMTILGLFGVAVGVAAAGPGGAGEGVKYWAGIWSLVTMFIGFLAGGWMAARTCGSDSKADGRLHGLAVWALGTVSLLYFAVSTTGMAAVLASLNGTARVSVTPGMMQNVTVTAAIWLVIATICGLIGGLIGGHAGGYTEVTTTSREHLRRVA